jgi:hypothetical protein
MALFGTAEMVARREINRGSIVINTTLIEVVAENIAVYAGATVDLNRQVEINNAWRWLWNGIRDRNLMETFGGVIYSGCDIDNISEAARLTSGVYATFGDNDVFIGVGQLVVSEWLAAVNPIETGFTLLRNQALEQTLKAA